MESVRLRALAVKMDAKMPRHVAVRAKQVGGTVRYGRGGHVARCRVRVAAVLLYAVPCGARPPLRWRQRRATVQPHSRLT